MSLFLMSYYLILASQLILYKTLNEDINTGQEDQEFRLLFMVSPAILLFMALAHLCIDWGGLIYHIGRVRYCGCNNQKLFVEHVDFSIEKVVLSLT